MRASVYYQTALESSQFKPKLREMAGFIEPRERFFFRCPHFPLPLGLQVIVADQVKIAMNEVECQFPTEIGPSAPGEGFGVVDRNADFSRKAHLWVAGKGDDIGGGGILHEIIVQATYAGVIEENYRQFSFGRCKKATVVEGVKQAPDLSWFVAELAMANLAPQVDLSWPCHEYPRFLSPPCHPDSRSGCEACLRG